MTQFGYSPTTTGVQTKVVNYNTRKNKAAETVNTLMKAAVTGVEMYKDSVDKDYKDSMIDASSQYREKKAKYIEGLDSVRNNPEAYQQYIDTFRSETEGLTGNLSEDDKNTFLNSSENFLMYQGFNVEQLQVKEQQNKWADTSSHIAEVTYNMEDKTLAKSTYEQYINEGINLGFTRKDGEEALFSAVNNRMIVSLKSEDMNYKTLSAMEGEINSLIDMYPKLKNSKPHINAVSNFKAVKNQLDGILEGKLNDSLTVKNSAEFKKLNKEGLANGAWDKEQYGLNKQKWVKKNVNTTSMQSEAINKILKSTNGFVSVDNLTVGNSNGKTYDGKNALTPSALAELKRGVTQIVSGLISAPNKDNKALEQQQTLNNSIFNKELNKQFSYNMNALINNINDPKASPESRKALSQQVASLAQLGDRFIGSLSEENVKKASVFSVIQKSEHITNKADALNRVLTSRDYELVSKNTTGLKNALVGVPQGDEHKAVELYSVLTELGIEQQDKISAIENTYGFTDLGDTDVKISFSAIRGLGIGEKSEDRVIPTLIEMYKGDKVKADNIKRISQMDNVKLTYENNEFIIRSGQDIVRLNLGLQEMDETTQKTTTRLEILRKALLGKAQEEDSPNLAQNTMQWVVDGIARDVESVANTYDGTLGWLGREMVGNITDDLKTVGGGIEYLYDGIIDNYDKWQNNLNNKLFGKTKK